MNARRRRLAAHAIKVAAQYRRLFPYGGFEDLDTAELQILLAVTSSQAVTPAAIAEVLGLQRQSVGRPVMRLQEAGLVEIRPHADDGRMKVVSSTSAGDDLIQRFLDQPN